MSENKCKCDLRTKLVGDGCRYCNPQDYIDHLHDALAAREWVGLTDAEMYKLWLTVDEEADRMAFGKAVEAKLKEKNT